MHMYVYMYLYVPAHITWTCHFNINEYLNIYHFRKSMYRYSLYLHRLYLKDFKVLSWTLSYFILTPYKIDVSISISPESKAICLGVMDH